MIIVSRSAKNLKKAISKLSEKQCAKTLIILDDVHGWGSEELKIVLEGEISKIKYRLGLSATPEREYDEEGNNFISNEVGNVIYKFSVEDAIERGILCEFDYEKLSYSLLPEEKNEIKSIIASYESKKQKGENVSEKDMQIKVANVRKTAENKLVIFEEFIKDKLDLLDYCIIFVQNKEYGEKVQQILIKYINEYHIYYSETDKKELDKFAEGKTKVLITCRKLNEGIDIKKCKNIILFASDRSKLVTIQRIGRCLRVSDDPNKKASVVDFVDIDSNGDVERSIWIENMALTRSTENEY
jgi:superfamily II DNA or RNA helicase